MEYVTEINVAYCFLTNYGELLTFHKDLNNPEVALWMRAMQEELVEFEALEVRRSTRERQQPAWHSEYVTEINVAYCFLIEDKELLTFHEHLNNPEVVLWMRAIQEEIEALHKNKT